MKGAILVFACETGLMPEEWIALERRDISRRDGILLIQRSYTARGGLKEYGKTARRRRRVPLSARAIAVLDELPARLNTRLIFPAPGRGPGVKTGQGGYLDLHNYRARDWLPAFDAAGVPRRRIYDTRHTFATFALHAGLSLFEVARYMGTSVRMIDLTYGHLVKGAEDQARAKLDLLTFGDTADQADQADQAAESDS
jgi:integrase